MNKEIIFANNFKKFRKLKGISQKEFAQRLYEFTGRKLTLTSVSNYETGMHMPPPQVLPVIANILEVSIDALFGAAQREVFVEQAEKEVFVEEEEGEVQEASLDKWKQELNILEKDFYYLKVSQDKALQEKDLPVLDCCGKLLGIAKKQQDELLVLQTELTTIREILSLLRA